MLDSTIISKRVLDNQKEIASLAQQIFSGLPITEPALVAWYKSGYLYHVIINHCLYQKKDRFGKIIETYLMTQRFSEFQKSFCQEIEIIGLDYQHFFSEFLKDETAIWEINPNATEFGNFISSIMVDLTSFLLKKNDNDFLSQKQFFEKLENHRAEKIIKIKKKKNQKEVWQRREFFINFFRYRELLKKLDDRNFDIKISTNIILDES